MHGYSEIRKYSYMNREWLKALLSEQQITQAELAEAMDMTAPRLSEVIHGRRRLALGEAQRMARFLGVTMEEVVAHAGQAAA